MAASFFKSRPEDDKVSEFSGFIGNGQIRSLVAGSWFLGVAGAGC